MKVRTLSSDQHRTYALMGARLELARIAAAFPELRDALHQVARLAPPPHRVRTQLREATRRVGRAPLRQTFDDGTEGTHECQSCGRRFTPDPRHRSRARVCKRKACKRWLSRSYKAAAKAVTA